jgi:hypothetical protein
MPYRFVKREPSNGQRFNADDCTVRAVKLATGMKYSDAWDLLYRLQGKHRACCFALFKFLDLEPDEFGVTEALSFPAVKGQARMTVREFAGEYTEGSYIVQVANHAAAIEDGVLYDTWDCGRKCVYKAWRIDWHPRL